MESIVYLDLTRKTASESLGGSSVNWPTFTHGEDITIGIRLAQRQEGEVVEIEREIVELRSSIGKVDERPESGKWSFEIDPEGAGQPIEELDHDVTAAELETIIGNNCTVEEKHGSYLIRLNAETVGNGDPVLMEPYTTNSLYPPSFVRHRVFTMDGFWVHELRLIQAPVASTDQSIMVLPPPPSITEIQAGGVEGTTTWNEVQSLKIPSSFRGTYQIKQPPFSPSPIPSTAPSSAPRKKQIPSS